MSAAIVCVMMLATARGVPAGGVTLTLLLLLPNAACAYRGEPGCYVAPEPLPAPRLRSARSDSRALPTGSLPPSWDWVRSRRMPFHRIAAHTPPCSFAAGVREAMHWADLRRLGQCASTSQQASWSAC
jgi:hypothetical protein